MIDLTKAKNWLAIGVIAIFTLAVQRALYWIPWLSQGLTAVGNFLNAITGFLGLGTIGTVIAETIFGFFVLFLAILLAMVFATAIGLINWADGNKKRK